MLFIDVIERLRQDGSRRFRRTNVKSGMFRDDKRCILYKPGNEAFLCVKNEYINNSCPYRFTPTWEDLIATDWEEVPPPVQLMTFAEMVAKCREYNKGTKIYRFRRKHWDDNVQCPQPECFESGNLLIAGWKLSEIEANDWYEMER